MSVHQHRIDKDIFLAEMAKRGWAIDSNGWTVPMGRRIHDRETDWLAAILMAIECKCPHEDKPNV